ncbi:MAG TPA: hypothetical protein VLV83_10775 [Acidobacteriota bacterium]|nr:hypothetical protein [Acidobacteriota bacterium]
MKFLKPLNLAAVAVVALAGLGIWGWLLDPTRPGRWAFVIFFLPLFWASIEMLQGGTGRRHDCMDWHRTVVAALGLMLAVGITSHLAVHTGLLDADWRPFLKRGKGVLFGLFLTLWGNYLPKLISPWREEEEWFDWQRVHRFVGWTASLCGLALIIAWLSLPLAGAKLATFFVTIAFCVLSVGRKFTSVTDYARRQPPPDPNRETS